MSTPQSYKTLTHYMSITILTVTNFLQKYLNCSQFPAILPTIFQDSPFMTEIRADGRFTARRCLS